MKPKTKLLFSFFLCSISSVIIAQPVNINTAKTIAEHHLASISEPILKSTATQRSTFHFTSVKTVVENKDTLYYILNDTINKGFVIVSADQRAWPILAYSTEGSFNEKKQPEAFTDWMDNRKKEIEYIKKNNIQADNNTIAAWENLHLKSSAVETTSVEPLIKTQWDQGCYYNSMCPTDAAGSCGHVATGCSATAMAQIMKFWNFPTKGIGSHSYFHPVYGNLSADFGSTTYQWGEMANNVTSENDAVATLMYHCGVSLETNYGSNASSAWEPRDELVKYFNYSSKSMLIKRDAFSSKKWIQILKSELDLGHPISYTGSSYTVGHAFICDGYQGEEYFHFNWGWSGSFDGYFYLGDLNPGGSNFSLYQFALIDLVPGDLPDGHNGFFLSSNVLDIATKGGTTSINICSSSNWTASCNQEWLSLNANSGVAGKTTLTLSAPENKAGIDRSATITISAAGFGTQTIIVNQLIKVNVTPGNLYNTLEDKICRTTQLTLKGTMDARDFKTMRDAMPALTDVDLSEVTIVAYTGTEGPNENNNIEYPENEIPSNAFNISSCQGHCFLKSIILPTTITSIGPLAFANSKNLTKIDIPESVTNIRDRAFNSCIALINVDKNNQSYSSIDGVLFNKTQTELIQCPISRSGNYTIPSSVTTIEFSAFESCSKLTGITMPSSVISIGHSAFSKCNGITSITIPYSVTSIQDLAFISCSALINVEKSNPNYSSIDGVLFDKEQTVLIHCPTSKNETYTIPSSVTSIRSHAFYECIGLTSVAIPSTVTLIEVAAFAYCRGLTTINIPVSVTAIGAFAVAGCGELTSISIPSSATTIGMCAFQDCRKLSTIIAYPISPINLNSSFSVFDNINKYTCTLYVPYGSKTSYQSANQWKDFTNIVEMSGILLSKNSIGMGPKANTTPIIISSSSNWNATSDQTWLTINPSSGTAGRDSINLTIS